MEYNYYPPQSGHPPSNVANQQQHQHGGPQQMQPQQQPQQGTGGQMIHGGPIPPQNNRPQAMPPQQQPQQPQHLVQQQHSHQMPSQQHPNYHHQIQQSPHPHGPHPGSPHQQPHQQPQQHHNHQPNLGGPPPSQQQQQPPQHHHHHMHHPNSPHHHSGPPPPSMHIQQQPPQQPQQMIRQPMGPSIMNHPQAGLQQPIHHNQNFFGGGPMQQSNMHHYTPQQNQHHHHSHHHHHQPPPPMPPQHHHHHHQPHHQSPMMHHASPIASHHPHMQQGIGRNSPYYPSILQTEIRVIELNRRLQTRPISRQNPSPLPGNPYDESLWWERFASEFFENDATLTISIQEDKSNEFTIGRTLIPRFFRTYFDGGVTDLSIQLRNPKEANINPHLTTLDCDQAFIITNNIFRHPAIGPPNPGVIVQTEGHLTIEFVNSNNSLDALSIKSWKFLTRNCREYIDRSITQMGLPHQALIDPTTRQGLTKSTISYLKMCMIMEPMQDLMFQNRQTKMDPRSCLRKLLFDKYKYRSGEDNRTATNKRRKRKPSAAPTITGATTNKKSKANINNSIANNSGLNNNMIMSPSGVPSFSLASDAVMVVGEPSMMGGDFGDDNERMITRLENTQYDPTASTPSNAEESDSLNASVGNENVVNNNGNSMDSSSIDNHTMSPSLLQQPAIQQHGHPTTAPRISQSGQADQLQQPQHELDQSQQPEMRMLIQDREVDEPQSHLQAQHPTELHEQVLPAPLIEDDTEAGHQESTLQQQPDQPTQEQSTSPQQLQDQQLQQILPQRSSPPQQQEGEQDHQDLSIQAAMESVEGLEHQQSQQPSQPLDEASIDEPKQLPQNNDNQDVACADNDASQHQLVSESKLNSMIEPVNNTNMLGGVKNPEQLDSNHTNNSMTPLNEESNSNSQLPCSTASTNNTMEQQQPVDNGVA